MLQKHVHQAAHFLREHGPCLQYAFSHLSFHLHFNHLLVSTNWYVLFCCCTGHSLLSHVYIIVSGFVYLFLAGGLC